MSIEAAFMVPHPPMIIPQVGRGSQRQIQKTIDAYQEVAKQIAQIRPETIIISSPHAPFYADYFSIASGKSAKGSFAQFRAPEVAFEEDYDEELVAEISLLAEAAGFPAGTLGQRDPALDHGTMVPLWFIRQHYREGRLVRIGLSGLSFADHYALGQMIQNAAANLNRRAVFIASGDLSHKLQSYGPYGYVPEGPLYDERIMDVCGRGAFRELFDFEEAFCEAAAECGHRSFVMMAGALDGMAVEAKALSHEDVTGVGYGICTFYPKEKYEDCYVKLARQSLECYVKTGRMPEVPEDLPEEMLDTRAGAFVSLHKHGKLRGCIGTIYPVTGSVAQEIVQNAISACSRDPRFEPVEPEELEWLDISVDVLGEPELVSDLSELDVKKYGVIVSHGWKRGLLLPDLEGVTSVEQQIAIAKQKAGIRSTEKVKLERFEVVRHH